MGWAMSLKRIIEANDTLSFQLAVRYIAVFSILSFTAFAIFYTLISSTLLTRTDQALRQELSEFSSHLFKDGIDGVKIEMVYEATAEEPPEFFFRLLTADGEILAATELSSGGSIPFRKSVLKKIVDDPKNYFETIHIPGINNKFRTIVGTIGNGLVMQIGHSLQENEVLLATIVQLLAIMLFILLLLTTLIGWILARRVLQSLATITDTATEISTGQFHKRALVAPRYREIKKLAATFNKMLDRIQKLMVELREVTDNIAHDLKSPITGIRGLSEIIISNEGSTEEIKKLSANTIDECERLVEMINTMLFISESESNSSIEGWIPIDIATVARQAVELFSPLFEEKQIELSESIIDHCFVNGQLSGIQRMVSNLLDNALKYTPEGGVVKISLNIFENVAHMVFLDTGIGISKKDLPHIFNRFYRADRSRSKSGNGLGLCLASAVAKAHGGSINVKSQTGKGSEFTISLPMVQKS
jgi:signal transduction histidine kinase